MITVSIQHILLLLLVVTKEMMKVKQREEVMHEVSHKVLSNLRFPFKRKQTRCQHWIDSSIFKATSNVIGRVSTVNMLEDQVRVIL